MSSNFISGLVSGLDTSALIDALVTSRSRPIVLLERRQAEKTAQLSAWQSLEAILISMKIETDRLASPALWDNLKTTSSDEEILTATAGSTAELGSVSFFVSALAQSEQRQSQEYASKDELVGEGTLSITVGSETTDLTVEAGTTLDALAQQINESEADVSAAIVRSVVDGEESFYLVLTGDETGAANTIDVTSALTGGTGPDFSAAAIRSAADAKIEFGGEGGLALRSSTNTFVDVLEGVDVTVHRTQGTGDDPITVEVSRDGENLVSVVSEFVARYNSTMSFINEQYRFDPTAAVRPPLMGNVTLTNIVQDLRSVTTRVVPGLESAELRTLFAVGIRSNADGTLRFDESAFREALDSNFDGVADLFRANATFDASGIEFLSAPVDVELAGEEYEIVISRAATRASLTGDEINLAGDLTIDATNDTFTIEIDGVTSESLTIAHGDYSDGDELANAIADAIARSDDLGALSVGVSFEETSGKKGYLVFTSNRYGSDGTIEISGGVANFGADLGLTSVVSTLATGEDVAGTVDGITAEGNGRILSIDDDHETLGGLSLRVALGDSETPATINATFSEGMGRVASRRLDSLTAAGDGTLSRVSSSLQRRLDGIAREIEVKLEQLEDRRARLAQQYASLESILGRLQNQGLLLNAQLQGLSSGFGVRSNR